MRKIVFIIISAVIFMALPSLVLAQGPAKYNFASSQGGKYLKVAPGGEGIGVIYFYNIDGNRITHIILEVSQAPGNWQVEIQPPLREAQVEMGGRIVTVTENLYIEPSEVLPQKAEDTPEGMACIAVGNRGYTLAKAANIIVRAPKSEEIGARGEITISAVAEWLGQTGAAAIKQARDFNFSVEVVSEPGVVREKIVKKRAPADKLLPIILRWLPTIIAVVIVILAAILIPRLLRKKDE